MTEVLEGASAAAYMRGVADGMDIAIKTIQSILPPEGITPAGLLCGCAEGLEQCRQDFLNGPAVKAGGA